MVCQPVLPMMSTIVLRWMSPIVAGTVLAVAGLLFGLPSVLLLAISVVLATAGVALLIARPHGQPNATIASERRSRAR